MYSASEEAPTIAAWHFSRRSARAADERESRTSDGISAARVEQRAALRYSGGCILLFAHSYAAPGGGKQTVAACDHGVSFGAVIEEKNLFGVQFHPENRGYGRARASQFSGVDSMTLARRIIPCLDVDAGRW